MKIARIFFIFGFLFLVACGDKSEQKTPELITVTTKTFSNTLYYAGTIRPLKTVVVASPVEGTVLDMPVQYGERVKAGDLLFVLSSTKFLTDYKTGLMAYIKAKSEFNTAQAQLTEAKFLHKNELISDDDMKTKQANYYATRLALVQAEDTLKSLLKQLNIKDINLYNLTIADIDKVTNALHLQKDSKDLQIRAPVDGVLLAASKSDEENKKILKGDVIKQGEALGVIGDLNGLSVRIKINELTVNELRTGQKVEVSGLAFPEETMIGEIKRIDKQGEATGGGIPTFTVDVIVPKLTPEQQHIIHVGMSAKVAIKIDDDEKIILPVTAVGERNGQSFVSIFDDKTGRAHEKNIRTGKTTADSVVVLAGLKVGDKVVAH